MLAVAGDDSDLVPAAAGGDIEQFLFHGVCRDDRGIYGFALASMGGDCISVSASHCANREHKPTVDLFEIRDQSYREFGDIVGSDDNPSCNQCYSARGKSEPFGLYGCFSPSPKRSGIDVKQD
jgi:hypothetical protein